MSKWCKGKFFYQAEDGIGDVERSRGLGGMYKRQALQDAGVKTVRSLADIGKALKEITGW